MIEEPYRWVEAIANRREYVETQLATGSPVVALSYEDGILLLTVGEQKLFEIYDRIALGAIGHPGDIERLRLSAIELASTEGFTRAAADVSLRRLAYYSLSPVMKNAFEQIYAAPFLARLLFAEIGAQPAEDFFLRVEYDGAISTRGWKHSQSNGAVLGGTSAATEAMETFLQNEQGKPGKLADALELALDIWTVGQSTTAEMNVPTRADVRALRDERLQGRAIAAAVVERHVSAGVCYRALTQDEIGLTRRDVHAS